VTKILGQLEADQILFYLPQIFQALTLKSGKIIFHFLLEYARKSNCFAHQLIWLAKVEGKQEKDPHNKTPRSAEVEDNLILLGKLAQKLIKDTKAQFNRSEKGFFHEVDDFYEQVTAISGRMQPSMTSAEKKDIIRAEVGKIKAPRSAYLPFDVNYQVVAINEDSGTPMQSAAKCPFLLSFRCRRY
jgi:phosphatidylinositol 4-kinase A